MKKLYFYCFLAGLAAVICVGCDKEPSVVDYGSTDEIVFIAGGPAFSADLQTKTEVTTTATLTSFDVAALTGTPGSVETVIWHNSFVKDGSLYRGERFWPSTDPSYYFYAANSPMTVTSAGATVTVDNTEDVVCVYAPYTSISYKKPNVLSFFHIFARLGRVTVTPAVGFTVSDVSIVLTPKVSGVYDIFKGHGIYDGTGWSSVTLGSSVNIAPAGEGSKDNDIYLIPGYYTLSASWTASDDNGTNTFTNKTKTVLIVGGKVNIINTTLGSDAEEITFELDVTAWDSEDQSVVFY